MRYLADPRLSVLPERLGSVKKVVGFVSSKGGVGKTLISVTTSLLLSRRDVGVGLLDMDVTNPTAHLAMGVDLSSTKPVEERGLVPPEVHGVKFMTPAFFTSDRPTPLRGESVSSAIREILSITRWVGIEVLIVDTPPGMSDELLELVTNVRGFSAVVVTTPSPLSMESALRVLRVLGRRASAVVVNMVSGSSPGVERLLGEAPGLPVYTLPYDPEVERALGSPPRILATEFAREVDRQVVSHILGGKPST